MRRTRWARWLVALAVVGLIVIGCAEVVGRDAALAAASGGAPASCGAAASAAAGASRRAAATCKGDGDKGTVKMMINQWVGAAANVAVAQCLLQQMGYKVETSTLAEEVAWQGFDTGEVDVILENWGHPDLEKKYITDKKVAQDAGPNGVTGIIGWYVPRLDGRQVPGHHRLEQPQQVRRPVQDLRVRRQGPVPRQRPDVRPVRRGPDHEPRAELQGRLLRQRGGHRSPPSRPADKNKTPLIGYFYDPQWLLTRSSSSRSSCRRDRRAATRTSRRSPATTRRTPSTRSSATESLNSGGDAATFIKNFKWANADQNSVADAITNKNMSPEDAAKAWIDANAATWQAWMP